MKIEQTILGGATGAAAAVELGASGYLLKAEIAGSTYYYLIDMGMGTKDDHEISWRPPIDLQKLATVPHLDAVLLTHAHRDHVGAVAMKEMHSLLREETKVIATRPSAAFLPYVLYDQREMSKKMGEKAPYGALDIYRVLRNRVVSVEKPKVLELVPNAISVLVWPSGHIRGGCSYIFRFVEGKQSVKIMWSGDYAVHNQLSTLGAPLPPPEWFPDVIASFDCTNGAEHIQPWQHEIERMADDGHGAVKGGGVFFTFAFAMDRCLTFARKLADLGLPVWMDGPSAFQLSEIMCGMDGFWCEGDRPISTPGITIADQVGEPLLSNEPVAVVAPSGMGHGPALQYLTELLPRENAVIGASGYVAPKTNGARILRAKRGSTVMLETDRGKKVEVTVAARCEQYRASAHSLREDAAGRIQELLSKSFMNRPTVMLAHGTSRAFDWFARAVEGYRVLRADRDRETILYE